MAVTGNVNTQVQIIHSTMPHLTALNRLVAPTPMIEVEMTWVVDKGMPQWVAN